MALTHLPWLSLWWEGVGGYYCHSRRGVRFAQAVRKAETGSITCPRSGWELAEQGFELGQPGRRRCVLRRKMKSPPAEEQGGAG